MVVRPELGSAVYEITCGLVNGFLVVTRSRSPLRLDHSGSVPKSKVKQEPHRHAVPSMGCVVSTDQLTC